MKPIDVIATYPRDGLPIPHRYRIADTDGSTQVIKVDRILYRTEEKLAGNRMLIYRCQSIIAGSRRGYELKYELIECSFTGARASLPAAGGSMN